MRTLRKLAAALGTTTRELRAERRGGEKVTKERKKVQRRLSRARQEMKAALQKVRDVQFSEVDVELLRSQNEAVQGMTRLLEAALSGDSDTDLDAVLAELEERRQWGERRGRGSW
jgi:hypothetical protein